MWRAVPSFLSIPRGVWLPSSAAARAIPAMQIRWAQSRSGLSKRQGRPERRASYSLVRRTADGPVHEAWQLSRLLEMPDSHVVHWAPPPPMMMRRCEQGCARRFQTPKRRQQSSETWRGLIDTALPHILLVDLGQLLEAMSCELCTRQIIRHPPYGRCYRSCHALSKCWHRHRPHEVYNSQLHAVFVYTIQFHCVDSHL